MATHPLNPEPPQRSPQDIHPKLPPQKKGLEIWPIVILVVAAAILISLVVFLPRAPRKGVPPSAAQVPPQPTGAQVQLTNLKLSTPVPPGSVQITGEIFNAGQTAINEIQVQATFESSQGQQLLTLTAPVMSYSDGQAIPLTEAVIPPGSQRPITIRLDQVPKGWDHAIPELRVINVTSQANQRPVR